MARRVLATVLVFLGLCGLAGTGEARVLKVPEEFKRIQDAMVEARPADTVLVAPGRYEGPLDVKNGVVLLSSDGPDVTTIVGHRWWVVRLADADTVTALIGFTVTGARGADRVVYCSGGGSPRILDNVVEKGWFGISCEDASPIIRRNVVQENKEGIACVGASPEITRNHVLRNYKGLVLTDASPRVEGNVIELNGTGVLVKDYSLPLLGGSIEGANDIYDNRLLNLVNEGKVKEDAIRTLEPLLLEAEYNYWGSDCPERAKFVGAVDFRPWVDKGHKKTFTSCPEK